MNLTLLETLKTGWVSQVMAHKMSTGNTQSRCVSQYLNLFFELLGMLLLFHLFGYFKF